MLWLSVKFQQPFNDAMFSEKGKSMMSQLHMMS